MKILVRGANWIGDAVMSVPALRELRRIFPDDRITLHTRAWAEGLFSDASFIDEIVTFDPHRWKIKDAIDNSDFLKDDGFELAVLLPNSFESALTSFLTRIPRRIGYNKDLRGLLLTDPVPIPEWKSRRHEVYYYLNLVGEAERRVLGRSSVETAMLDGRLEISAERQSTARQYLYNSGVPPDRCLVALGVGSANSPEKRWPVECFARLIDLMTDQLDCHVLLLGSKEDAQVVAAVRSLVREPVSDISGRTELSEAAAILSIADLMVSNDTGLAHVAPAVGTNTITIFGPTDPETTRPFSAKAVVVRSDDGSLWPSVEIVLSAVKNQLAKENDVLVQTSSIC